ncbi:MAG: ATP-binding cassette domain-containing protein [Rikenellaceae bacterium]|nr:ATP-binding cassette domain-containing protein [Rikenellaceae bacterium]
MERIELQQVIPAVFADTPPVGSGVWLCGATLDKGRSYLIEASSGLGKTTLCSYLYGWRSDYSGTVLYDGEDIRGFGVARWTELRRRDMAILFQDMKLFGELTALENLRLKNDLTGRKTEGEIVSMLGRLGLGDKADSPAALLSAGQQQRVAFVRALCQPFDFIVLDEPVSHLDEANSALMRDLLTEEARAQGAGIIVTSIGKHFDMPYDNIIKL